MRFAPRSAVSGIVWPALPDAPSAMLLALAFQLEHSQWWTPQELAAHQATQRAAVVTHAIATVPHYQGLDPQRLPILTRAQLIDAGDNMLSRAYPRPHGPVEEIASSRTTGQPVRVRGNGVVASFWQAITLRDHVWQKRDLTAHLAMIKHLDIPAPAPDGVFKRGWTLATSAFAPEAPMSVLSIATTTDDQLGWLQRVRPDYLIIYPTALDALLRKGGLPSLRGVATVGEVLSDETRARCREVLGLPIADTYSAAEVGPIALTCPDHGQTYHVQSERLLVEILDDDGAPCPPGATGRVVITDLHNFATPLLRYEIGDLAEVAPPCPCGRGLPALARVHGRRRNMLTYPDGRTIWPVFAVAARRALAFREVQLVQVSRELLRARVVADGAVPADASGRLADALTDAFGHRFALELEVVDALRGPGGKLEEFVSLIA